MLGETSWNYWEQMGRSGGRGREVGEEEGQPRGGRVVGLCVGGDWTDPQSDHGVLSRLSGNISSMGRSLTRL